MRNYKPVIKSRRGRMLRAARMRGEGMSLRQIAAQVGVSYQTVLRDLRAWDAEQAQVSHLPVTKVTPGGHERDTGSGAGCDSDATVIPLRRRA